MEAPKCRTCGERHWDRVCPEAKPLRQSDADRNALRQRNAKPASRYGKRNARDVNVTRVTENVTRARDKSVTRDASVTPKLDVALARIAELEAEVKQLKRLLAERGDSPAMTAAERMRKYRERKRNVA